MGTNYYGKKIPPAENLNAIAVQMLRGNISTVKIMLEPFEEIHIGKNSLGWRFLFNHNNRYVVSIEEHKDWLQEYQIFYENGEIFTFEEFWSMVEIKQRQEPVTKKSVNFDQYIIIDGYEFSTSTEFC